MSWTKLSETLGIVGGLIGIFAFIMSLLQGADAIVAIRGDNYQVFDPNRLTWLRGGTKEFSQLKSQPFSLVTQDSNLITQPIYMMEVSIWNRGNTLLGSEKLRSPLELLLPDATTIIGKPQITYADPRDELIIKTSNNKPSTVELQWRYLDPGKGFRVQIVYEANRPSTLLRTVYLEGRIENANEPVTNRYPLQSIMIVAIVLTILMVVARFTLVHHRSGLGFAIFIVIQFTLIWGLFYALDHGPALSDPPF